MRLTRVRDLKPKQIVPDGYLSPEEGLLSEEDEEEELEGDAPCTCEC